MKIFIVLFAVVAVATCKPSHDHQQAPQAPPQTFQVQVQAAPQQQQQAPPPEPPVSIQS